MIAARISDRLPPAWLAPACVAGLALAAGPSWSESANATGTDATSRAQFDLRIVVPARVTLVTLAQHENVDIRAEHLRQGYIDLHAATTLQITHNTRHGLRLSAASLAHWIDQVDALLLGQQVSMRRETGSAPLMLAPTTAEAVSVNYRLHLNAHATPGRQAWPLRLSLSADRF